MIARVVNRGATIKTVRVTDLPPRPEIVEGDVHSIGDRAAWGAAIYDAALAAAGETRSSLFHMEQIIYPDDPDTVDVLLHTD